MASLVQGLGPAEFSLSLPVHYIDVRAGSLPVWIVSTDFAMFVAGSLTILQCFKLDEGKTNKSTSISHTVGNSHCC